LLPPRTGASSPHQGPVLPLAFGGESTPYSFEGPCAGPTAIGLAIHGLNECARLRADPPSREHDRPMIGHCAGASGPDDWRWITHDGSAIPIFPHRAPCRAWQLRSASQTDPDQRLFRVFLSHQTAARTATDDPFTGLNQQLTLCTIPPESTGTKAAACSHPVLHSQHSQSRCLLDNMGKTFLKFRLYFVPNWGRHWLTNWGKLTVTTMLRRRPMGNWLRTVSIPDIASRRSAAVTVQAGSPRDGRRTQ
jgi:hypothetical protein